MSYSSTYIQKSTENRKDVFLDFGILLKSIPLNPFPDLKEIPKRDWADKQGDDEYLSSIPIFKAYETDVKFIYKGELGSARKAIYEFILYLTGSEFSIFDTWKGVGFRCRYVSYNESAFYRKQDDVVEFSLKFKVNNPLSYGVSTDNGIFHGYAGCDMMVYLSNGSVLNLENEDLIDISNCEFFVVSPNSATPIITQEYKYRSTQLSESEYIKILTPSGVKNITL